MHYTGGTSGHSSMERHVGQIGSYGQGRRHGRERMIGRETRTGAHGCRGMRITGIDERRGRLRVVDGSDIDLDVDVSMQWSFESMWSRCSSGMLVSHQPPT